MKNCLEARYKGYFRKHYGASFSKMDIENYRKWFYAQWRFINSKVKIKKSSRILELGAGLGGFCSLLSNNNQYIGLELDQEAVNFANKYFDKKKIENPRSITVASTHPANRIPARIVKLFLFKKNIRTDIINNIIKAIK